MFQVIVVGIDGSERTKGILAVAQEMARRCEASLHVICAIDPAYFLQEKDGLRPDFRDEIDYPAAAREREGADTLVHATVSRLRGEGLIIEGDVVAGEPAECLLESARVLRADLIILGHRHLSWLEKWTEGSVCREVLERAWLPVLVVPSSESV